MSHLNTESFAGWIHDRLVEEEAHLQAQWRTGGDGCAQYFALDNALPDDAAKAVAAAFPADGPAWRRLDSFRERKKTFAKLDAVDPLMAAITDAFHAEAVLSAISRITAINGLEADPSLYASGLSVMDKGDFLNPHIDNSHDAVRARYRRLNLLYYVSEDWSHEKGGNLELWDGEVKNATEIISAFNRLVVMETNKSSWHSVNPVIAEAPRRCVSNYYFSAQSPSGEDYYHVTSFLGRPDQPLRRLIGRADNFLRQTVASLSGYSRGKHLARD